MEPRSQWRITAGPYEAVGDDDANRVDWIWVVSRGPDVRAVRVSVAPDAWVGRTAPRAPKLVRDAIASRGATAVIEAVRACDEPAPLIEIDLAGVQARPGGA